MREAGRQVWLGSEREAWNRADIGGKGLGVVEEGWEMHWVCARVASGTRWYVFCWMTRATALKLVIGELDVVEGKGHEGALVEGGLSRGLKARTDGLEQVTKSIPQSAPVLDTDGHERASLVEGMLLPLGVLLRFALRCGMPRLGGSVVQLVFVGRDASPNVEQGSALGLGFGVRGNEEVRAQVAGWDDARWLDSVRDAE